MASYLFIESRDLFEVDRSAQRFAAQLAREQHTVTVFLVQNAVLAARKQAVPELLDELRAAGVDVYVDDFSLRERGIAATQLAAKVSVRDLDLVLNRLADGTQTLWH